MKKKIFELLPYVIIALVVIVFRVFIATPALVVGGSMEKTLYDKEVVILNKISYKFSSIKRFDVVIIDNLRVIEEPIVKRIIGLPGDTLYYKDNKLYINNKLVEENFDHAATEDFNLEEIGYYKIPANKYFVLGDNRGKSTDSRFIGLIDRKNIIGKASFIIWPLNKIGSVK